MVKNLALENGLAQNVEHTMIGDINASKNLLKLAI